MIKLRTALSWALTCLILTSITSCATSDSYLAKSRINEKNRTYLLEQKQREEEAKYERFKINANRALSQVTARLTLELYEKLGKGNTPSNNFEERNIKYYYSNQTAECPITIRWERRNKEIVISGTLSWINSNTVKFVCTNAENTRLSDKKYIRTLSEGVYYTL